MQDMAKAKYLPTLDALVADPAKAAMLPPETAQALLIELASLQPLLLQRALMASRNGNGTDILLTIPEVAQQLKVSTYRAYELCRQGAVKSVRLGKSVRVKASAVADYLAQQGA
jgi:excisionase family DNA binding protein